MSVDKRVVEMVFNNKQFEDGIQSSLSSLEALNKTLGSTDNVSALTTLATGVEGITNKFSIMGIAGMTAVSELTKSTINMAKNATNTLFGLISGGGKQRALNIEQAKFQFMGLGMDIEKAMEDSLYAVKGTAYGLDAAAKAASQLGASGIQLGDEMKGALRGISGVAAMTNSDYESISHIFTTVAGQGKMMTMQLRQLENRGLNVAATMAESMGTTEANIRAMVTDGEIDFNTFATVMNDTFGEHATKANETYAGSLSNMKAALSRLGAGIWTEQLINFRDIFNTLSGTFDNVFDAINPLVKEFTAFSRVITKDVITAIEGINIKPLLPLVLALKNVFVLLANVARPIKEAFTDIFPAKTGRQVFEITNAIKLFTKELKLSDSASENIKRTFKGLFALLDIGVMFVSAIAKGLGRLVGYLLPATDGILDFTGGVGDFIVSIRDAIKESNIFEKVVDNLGGVFKFLADGVMLAKDKISELFSNMGISNDIFGNLGGFIKKAFGTVFGIIEQYIPIVANIAKVIGNEFGKIWSSIKETFTGTDYGEIVTIANSGVVLTIIYGIKKLINAFTDVGKKSGTMISSITGIFAEVKKTLAKVTGILDGVRKSLEAYQQSLKAKTLKEIAIAIAILAGSLVVLSLIDSTKLARALGALSVLLVEFFIAMSVMEKQMGGLKFKGALKTTGLMLALSTSILILSFALSKIAKLDIVQLTQGLVGVGVLMTMLMKTVNKMDNKKLKKSTKGLMTFAIAINILAMAVKKLGDLDVNTLVKGLGAVGILIAEIVLMSKFMKGGIDASTGVGLIGLAIALNILATAVGKFGSLDINTIVKGLGAMGMVLLEIVLFTKATGDTKGIVSTAIGLTIMAGAMLIFGSAIDKMGGLSIEVIAKGLGTMAGALTVIGVALKLMPKGLTGMGVGLTIMVTALVILSKALSEMGSMSMAEIAKSLVVLAGSLAIMSVAVHAFEETLAGSASILVMSGALVILAVALQKLGEMSMAEIGKSMLTLVGAFVVLGAAVIILTPVVPTILALAAALLMMSVGVGVLGVGLFAVSAGLTALAVAGSAGTAALVGLLTGVIKLIPIFLESVGKGIVALATAIGDGAPAIVDAVVKIIDSLMDAAITLLPKLGELIIELIDMILNVLTTSIPDLVRAGMELILGILEGIRDNIFEIIVVAGEIVVAFIDGIAETIPSVIDSGINLIVSFINGMADGIRDNTDAMIEAITNLMTAIIEAGIKVITQGIPDFLKKGKETIKDGFAKGIEESDSDVIKSVTDIAGKAIDSFGTFTEKFKKVGEDVVSGFASGIDKGKKWVSDAVTRVSNAAVFSAKTKLDTHSPSKVFDKEVGQQIPAGMADGIKKGTPKVKKASKKMAKTSFEATKEWIDKQKKYFDLSLEDEYSKWKSIQGKYKKDSKERLEIDLRMRQIMDQRRKDSYDHSVKWMDNEKFYDRMTKEEELAGWERMQARYKKGTDERINADKKVYSLKKELIVDSYNHSVEWIENEKFYNRMSTAQEYQAYLRVQARYKEGTKERKDADKKLYSLKKAVQTESYNQSVKLIDKEKEYGKLSLADELVAWEKIQARYLVGTEERIAADKRVYDLKKVILEKTEDLEKTYQDAVKSRANSIKGSYGLFDEIAEIEEAVTGSTLVKNLDDQLTAIKTWRENLKRLSDKGVTEGLLTELSDMGPKSLEQLQALNNLSSGELDRYVGMWETKTKLATDQAIYELVNLRKETDAEIALLNTATENGLGESSLSAAAEDMTDDVVNAFSEMGVEVETKVETMKDSTETKFEDMADNVMASIEDKPWETLGINMVMGIVEGVSGTAHLLTETMVSMARSAVEAANAVLDIHSPSRVFKGIGENIVLGMVEGVTTKMTTVTKSMYALGDGAIDVISETLAGIGDILNDNMHLTPTITPVLDMDNVVSGLDSVFNDQKTLAYARRQTARAATLSKRTERDTASVNNSTSSTTNNFTVNAVIRKEADIEKVSQGLYKLQTRANRGRGLVYDL